jgi:hypothetical protein
MKKNLCFYGLRTDCASEKKEAAFFFKFIVSIGVPNEIRTRVTAVKGRCPRPLDDGDKIDL